jgi:hypothetical protein
VSLELDEQLRDPTFGTDALEFHPAYGARRSERHVDQVALRELAGRSLFPKFDGSLDLLAV